MRVETVAKAIEIPVDCWAGACYGIASAVLKAGLVKGQLRYGHWLGPVSSGCSVKSFIGRPFTHHGWIELKNQRIFDPTRWVFEAAQPYIYIGTNDHYDPGGNALREAMEQPCPWTNSKSKTIELLLSVAASDYLQAISDAFLDCREPVSIDQIFWLSNLSPNRLGNYAQEIYRAIISAGLEAFIPIDNRTMVIPEVTA